MRLRITRQSLTLLGRLALVLLLVCSFVAMATGELWAADCGDDCHDRCDDDCGSCDACIHCLPLVQMIPQSHYDCQLCQHDCLWTVVPDAVFTYPNPAFGIDHPPQNS